MLNIVVMATNTHKLYCDLQSEVLDVTVDRSIEPIHKSQESLQAYLLSNCKLSTPCNSGGHFVGASGLVRN